MILEGLHFFNAVPRLSVTLSAGVAVLGFVSGLLILAWIVKPPRFGSVPSSFDPIIIEGTIRAPIFLALFAAAGIFVGGWRAVVEERAYSRS